MKKIIKVLPIITERCLIRPLQYEDINWYINTIRQPFFGEYMDVKPNNESEAMMTGKLIALISSYKIGLIGKNEIRAVITVDGISVGGISIFTSGIQGTYDIGYWVIPAYQGIGIASEALVGLTNKLEFNLKGLKLLRLIIRVDNAKSIKLAKKTGYKFIKSFQGKEKENLMYGYEPIKFC